MVSDIELSIWRQQAKHLKRIADALEQLLEIEKSRG